MIRNRTQREPVIIPFPVERARERKPVEGKDGKMGQLLLYTGVRYERWHDSDAEHHTDDHRPPPRRGGSRS